MQKVIKKVEKSGTSLFSEPIMKKVYLRKFKCVCVCVSVCMCLYVCVHMCSPTSYKLSYLEGLKCYQDLEA